MKITEKLSLDINGLIEHGAINIVIFGDSVSHGSFNGYFDYDAVYHSLLRKKLLSVGDIIVVRVKSVDPVKKRIGLTRKKVNTPS